MASTSLIIRLGAQVSGAVTGIRSVYSGLDRVVQKVTSLSLVKVGSLVGLVTAGAGIGGVATKIFQLGARAETTRLSFQTMLGSIQAGDAMMAKLDRFSNSTPYSGDQFAKKATDTVAKWQADAQQKQNERNNAKQDTKPEQPRAAAAGAAPTLKRDRLMTDRLTKIGL